MLAVAACQPLPQPFQPDDKDIVANPLLALPGSAGVQIRLIQGAPEPTASALTSAIATALQDEGLPASTTGNAGSYVLLGAARLVQQEAGRDQVEIGWSLLDPTGIEVKRHESRWWVNQPHWQLGTPETLKAMAVEAAPALAHAIQGDPVEQVAPKVTGVTVWAVDGAPGDGNAALRRSIMRILRQRGVTLVPEVGDDTLVVLGSVAMDDLRDRKQQVTVRWSVIRPDGSEVGVVEQSNAVPAGSLDNAWGPVALYVAEAAADGITALIETVNRR